MRRSVGKVVARVRRSLSPELLTPTERRRRRSHPVAGHCAVASEATYHLLGATRSGYVLFVASWVERGGRRTHWWLVRKRDGFVVDPTAEQFSARKRAQIYARGRACGFSTPKRGRRSQPPSKRAQVVIERVLVRNVQPQFPCFSCGGAAHPVSGSVLPSGKIVCGRCVREFIEWTIEHSSRTFRVGPRVGPRVKGEAPRPKIENRPKPIQFPYGFERAKRPRTRGV